MAKGKFKPQKGVTPPHLKKYLFKKGHGKVAKGASAAASRVSSGVSKARGAVGHRAHGFINSFTPEKGAKLLIMADGALETLANIKKYGPGTNTPPAIQAQQILLPMIDAAIASKQVGIAVDKMAPGFAGDLAEYKVFGGGQLNATPRRVGNAIPSLISWGLAIKRYRELRKQNAHVVNENLLPRTGAMLGLRLRNTTQTGGGDVIMPAYGAGATIKDAVISSPAVYVGAGALGSKVIAKVNFI